MANNKVKSSLFIILIILLGIMAAIFLYFYQNLYPAERFLPGVKITSLSVQGHSKQEAADLLEAHLQDILYTPVKFYSEDYIYETNMSQICMAVDSYSQVEEVWQQETKRSLKSKLLNLDGSREIGYPVEIQYNTEALDKIIQVWSQSLESQPVNAQLEIDRQNGLIIIPGKSGRAIDRESTLMKLPQTWEKAEKIEIPIVIDNLPPEVSESDLENMGELAAYSTWYNAGETDRSYNLNLAATAINGCVVRPGQEFSFNKTVGERTQTGGYRDALVIVGDKFEPGLGGGICQVSSTLYNACLLAGLDIVERHNHALAVAYVPLGLDATVAYGLQDYRFRNSTDYPLYIRAVAGGGKLTVNIYGHLESKANIQLGYVIDQVIDFKEIREADSNLKPGEEKIDHKGFPGYIVRSFRTYLTRDGQLIKKEMLAKDRYRPLNTLIYVGPPEEELPPISDDQPPEQPDGLEPAPPTPEPDGSNPGLIENGDNSEPEVHGGSMEN